MISVVMGNPKDVWLTRTNRQACSNKETERKTQTDKDTETETPTQTQCQLLTVTKRQTVTNTELEPEKGGSTLSYITHTSCRKNR